MSLLTAPLHAAGRCVDDLARVLLPIGLIDRLRDRRGYDLWLDDDEVPILPGEFDPEARADRARTQAESYLSRRRQELRRELDRRRGP